MLKLCVFVPLELVAVTTPVNVPAVVQLPVMAPALLKVSPPGSAPEVTEKVGAG